GFVLEAGALIQHRVEAREARHREEESDPALHEMTRQIIGLGMEVHRHLGAGLLESVYEACLYAELQRNGLAVQRQVRIPLIYKGLRLPLAYSADLIVAGSVILEIKSVEIVLPVHKAQLLTYLRLSGCRIGLLMNFNEPLLKNGIHRLAM
ncbi:MAG: GxxExxY protein, partial [Rhodospirillales bacterium]|nr:GxxExxY protein [Rhodospirillales bacterium]